MATSSAAAAIGKGLGGQPPMGPPLVFEAKLREGETQSGTVVWSHGLGDTAHGWADFAVLMQRNEKLRRVKWILSNAPKRPITGQNGYIMPAWFDSKGFNAPPSAEDHAGMLASMESIRGLVQREVEAGVERGRIVVGGFSQGGALSLLTGLLSPEPLGGVCCLSGFLGMTHSDKLKALVKPASAQTPIFWGHGTSDPIIRLERAERGRSYLRDELGRQEGEDKDFLFRTYEGLEHSLGREEMKDVERWLKERFA
ncbi:hypothetical protein JCM10207_004129 [Rhodosporidiobolus poonsookiae]